MNIPWKMGKGDTASAFPAGELKTTNHQRKRTNENTLDLLGGSSTIPRDSVESEKSVVDIPDVAKKGLILDVQKRIARNFRDNPVLTADQELSLMFLDYENKLDEISQVHEELCVFKSNLDSCLSAWESMTVTMCTQAFARKHGLEISVVFRHCRDILERNRISFEAANEHHPSSLLTANSPEHLDWSHAMKHNRKLVTLIKEASLDTKDVPDLAMSLKKQLEECPIPSEADSLRRKCLIPCSSSVDESLLMVCICRYLRLDFECARETAEYDTSSGYGSEESDLEQLFSKLEHLSWPKLYTLEQKEMALISLERICAKFDPKKNSNLENLSECQIYALESYVDTLDCGLESGMDRITSMESRCKEDENNIQSAKYQLAHQITIFFYLMGGCTGRRLIDALEKGCREQIWDALPEDALPEEYDYPDRAGIWRHLLETESGLRDVLTAADVNFADLPFLVNSVYAAMYSIEIVMFAKEFLDDMNAVPVFREVFSDEKQKRIFGAICSWQKVKPEVTGMWLFPPGKYMCA